jgi:polyhydroxyalkanoate synthesis regulator protein
VLSDLQDLARRLEQQLKTYERMHTDELKRFQDQWIALAQVQSDELKMMCEELDQLKQELAALQDQSASAEPVATASPVELTITRREFITGNFMPHT